MHIKVKKDFLEKKCKKVITNIKAAQKVEETYQEFVELNVAFTKRKYKFFGKKIKPDIKVLEKIYKDEETMEPIKNRLLDKGLMTYPSQMGDHWRILAEKILKKLPYVEGDELTLTTDDEIQLLEAWEENIDEERE